MKLKYIAFAAALVLSAPAMAAPTVPSVNQSLTNFWSALSQTSWWELAGQTYSGGIANTTISTAPGVVLTNTYGLSWTLQISAAVSNVVKATGLENAFSISALQIGGQTIPLAPSFTPANSVNASHTLVAVPGPEAGAGLGALAMGGIALYLKRRRKEEALAA